MRTLVRAKALSAARTPSEEGLLAVPLVRQLFSDPSVRIGLRAIDRNWIYQKIFGLSTTGFNPFERDLYVARISALAAWIRAGKRNDRLYNPGDALVNEVLFLVHDYLHVWARMVIQSEFPELEFGHGRITRRSIDAFAFCHLATEAVATVGLDYWYLSTVDLDAVTGIGTCVRNLVCAYREDDLPEYRRFHATYEVQHPDFFVRLAEFYATGEFDGFSAADALASPKLLRWIEHELTYGKSQRTYIRAWLSHLSNGAVTLSPEELSAPIAMGKKWQRALLQKLGALLWRKVKKDELSEVRGSHGRHGSGTSWARDVAKDEADGRAPNFCFTNLNRVPRLGFTPGSDAPTDDIGQRILRAQWLSRYELATVPREVRKVMGRLVEAREFTSLEALFRKHGVRRVRGPVGREPVDLFLLP